MKPNSATDYSFSLFQYNPGHCHRYSSYFGKIVQKMCVTVLLASYRTAHCDGCHSDIGCPNKNARFNFLIKRIIYLKSVNIFISALSTHTAINCGTQYPTNVPHDSAGTLFLFCRNSRRHFRLIVCVCVRARARVRACAFWCRIHLRFRWMGGLHAKSMTSQRYRATYKMANMRYYGNVMTTTRWRLYVILHLQQYSRRLNFFCVCVCVCVLLFIIEPVSSNFLIILWTVDWFGAFRRPKIPRILRNVSA